MVIAHRGDPHRYRENTLPALRAAVEAGADALALDLALTGDGHIVAVHPEALHRLWGHPRPPAETTLTDLAILGGGEARIPTLLEVLAEFARPGLPPLLLHVPSVEVALGTDDAVQAHGLPERTFYAGSHDAMRALRSRRGSIHLTLTWHDQGLPPAELWESIQPRWYNAHHALLTPELVAELHRHGYGVLTWTAGEPIDMPTLLSLGVDGILTDRVRELLPHLRGA
jgi:glycerophosphoryl diester phosphodiesterase